MARLTDEERNARRKGAAILRRRAEVRASGIYTREDKVDGEFGERETAPSLKFAITKDGIECGRCIPEADGEGLIFPTISTSVDGLQTRKLWRCPRCQWTMTGQWTTYVMQEEPGR